METIWVVASTALLVFCLNVGLFMWGYKRGKAEGYLKGANDILAEWKLYIREDDKND